MLKKGEEPAMVLAGLSRTLESRGHLKLHNSILRGVLREFSASTKGTTPKLTLANKADTDKLKNEIENALKLLGSEGEYVINIDKTITGGFVLTHNHRVVDSSYKTKLLNWYRNATSTRS